MTKHTPTPWRKGSTYYNVIDESGFNIADCTGMDRTVSERQANVEFIVRACNSHDKLVMACTLGRNALLRIPDRDAAENIVLQELEQALTEAGAK